MVEEIYHSITLVMYHVPCSPHISVTAAQLMRPDICQIVIMSSSSYIEEFASKSRHS